DQANAAPGVGDGRRRGDRGGGAGPGALHADARLRSRLSRVRGEAVSRLRGRLMPDVSYLEWPFFEERHRALATSLDAWCAANRAWPATSSASTSSTPQSRSSP